MPLETDITDTPDEFTKEEVRLCLSMLLLKLKLRFVRTKEGFELRSEE